MDRRLFLTTAVGGTLLSAGCMNVSTTGETDYKIRADERSLPENESVSQVSPLPAPLRRAIDEASRPKDEDGGDVTTSREKFRAAIRPFCNCSLSDITPAGRITERVYYVRRSGQVYRVRFRILGEG